MIGSDNRDDTGGTMDASHDISVLNSLIETTIDSVDGYRRSAQEATNSRFSAEFLDRASDRERVVSQLRDRVRQLGGTPEDDGSVLAAAHRAFLSLRDKVSGSDDAAIIAEVDHGESYLNGKWETALGDDRLSPQTRSLIQQCYDSVREGHERFRRAHEDSSGGTAGGAFETAGSAGGAASTGMGTGGMGTGGLGTGGLGTGGTGGTGGSSY